MASVQVSCRDVFDRPRHCFECLPIANIQIWIVANIISRCNCESILWAKMLVIFETPTISASLVSDTILFLNPSSPVAYVIGP